MYVKILRVLIFSLLFLVNLDKILAMEKVEKDIVIVAKALHRAVELRSQGADQDAWKVLQTVGKRIESVKNLTSKYIEDAEIVCTDYVKKIVSLGQEFDKYKEKKEEIEKEINYKEAQIALSKEEIKSILEKISDRSSQNKNIQQNIEKINLIEFYSIFRGKYMNIGGINIEKKCEELGLDLNEVKNEIEKNDKLISNLQLEEDELNKLRGNLKNKVDVLKRNLLLNQDEHDSKKKLIGFLRQGQDLWEELGNIGECVVEPELKTLTNFYQRLLKPVSSSVIIKTKEKELRFIDTLILFAEKCQDQDQFLKFLSVKPFGRIEIDTLPPPKEKPDFKKYFDDCVSFNKEDSEDDEKTSIKKIIYI